ncbi:MAG TPA: superoxide dismutase family protein [Kofleriaceae bacterium]|nr:superoxide dismutase family protein [Kofleriaceae bacterium]
MTNQATWKLFSAIALAAALAAAGCKKDEKPAGEQPATGTETEAPTAETPPEQPTGEETPAAGEAQTAAAELKPAEGSKVSGTVTFTEKDGQVEVALDLQGLTPGDHGFHVHENGDCSAPDFKSAGDHFNPAGDPHGSPDDPAAKHHAGDFGNITAGEDGTVKTTKTVDFITVAEGERSVVGRAVVVHEKADDLKSQPSGDAGGRIACGVVEKK